MRMRLGHLLVLAAAGCSSVPDVRFIDGGTTSSSTTSGGTGEDAGACPQSTGVCCGTVRCDGCDSPISEECADCEDACNAGQRCCKRRGPPVCIDLAEACP